MQGKIHVKTVFWHLTLTYIARIAKVKVDLHAKEGHRSNGSAVRAQTNGRTYGRTERQTDRRGQ